MINNLDIKCNGCNTAFNVPITAPAVKFQCPSCKKNFYVVSATYGPVSSCSICDIDNITPISTHAGIGVMCNECGKVRVSDVLLDEEDLSDIKEKGYSAQIVSSYCKDCDRITTKVVNVSQSNIVNLL